MSDPKRAFARDLAWSVVALVGLVCVLIIDINTELGFAAGSLYVPVVLLSTLTGRSRVVIAISLACGSATLAGYWLSPPHSPELPNALIAINRGVSVAVIATTCALAVLLIRLYKQAAADKNALERSLRLGRIAGRVANLGGWSVTLADNVVQWSDEVCRIHEEPPGFNPSVETAINYYAPEFREQISSVFQRCAELGEVFDDELQIITSTGTRRWVRTTGEAVRDSQGRIIEVQGAFKDITEAKRKEALLAKSTSRFHELAKAMPLIIWSANAEGRFTYVSAGPGAKMGASGGGDWAGQIHPDDRERCQQAWSEAISSGIAQPTEFRLRMPDGNYRWHLSGAVPVRDENGAIEQWIGTATDVDEQKQLQHRAEILARRLTTTWESITDGLLTLDRDWRFRYLNSQAARLLERSQQELIGKNIWEVFPEAKGGRFDAEYSRAMALGRPARFEQAFEPLDKIFEVNAYPSDEGLAVYFRDVSELRAADARLRLLETAVSRLNDVVLITEAEPIDEPGPRIVFVNEAFEHRTGYTREEAIGRSPRFLQGPKTDRAVLGQIRQALERWQPVRAELLNYTKSGDEIWLELDIVPIADESGWYTHWVSVERDVTERRQIAEQVQQSQRMESIGQLTGGIAHDFNNLLTVIQGNAELLTEQLADPKHVALAQMIDTASQRGAELTHHLLAFARKQPLEPRIVNIDELIVGMDHLLRRSLGEHIQIELVHAEVPWLTLIDPAQLESALLNLCLNARDAMPKGGKLIIETASMQLTEDYVEGFSDLIAGDYVMLAVTDNGSGISAKALPRVFEPFFTTKEMGKGTGLGLSMVYGFVKQSNGHARIYSEPGEGTTVKLYFPRLLKVEGQASSTIVATDAEGGGETILLVEDDKLVREFSHSQLLALGYRILEASNGKEALQILAQDIHIDLLFTDVVMPGGIGGKQLADTAVEARPDLKVLFTSGYTENAIIHHGRLDPGVNLLSKPYRVADLARAVRRAMG